MARIHASEWSGCKTQHERGGDGGAQDIRSHSYPRRTDRCPLTSVSGTCRLPHLTFGLGLRLHLDADHGVHHVLVTDDLHQAAGTSFFAKTDRLSGQGMRSGSLRRSLGVAVAASLRTLCASGECVSTRCM